MKKGCPVYPIPRNPVFQPVTDCWLTGYAVKREYTVDDKRKHVEQKTHRRETKRNFGQEETRTEKERERVSDSLTRSRKLQ